MNHVGVQVEGARRLRRTLRQAGDDLTELKGTHARVARMVARAAKPPRRPGSGRLAATGRSSGTKTAAIVRAGTKRVPYAAPIHWGWLRPNSNHPTARGGPIMPNPWLAKAAKYTEAQWVGIYTRFVEQTLDKVKGA